jgi:hypothetical protein
MPDAVGDTPRICHVCTPINPRRARGNSFYKLRLSEDENGSQTFCGAPASSDLTYAETVQRRPGFDWTAWLRTLPPGDAMAGMVICAECLRKALNVKAQRADAIKQRKVTT